MEHPLSERQSNELVNIDAGSHALPMPTRLSPLARSFVPRAPPSACQPIRITTPSGVPIVLPVASSSSRIPEPVASKSERRPIVIRIESLAEKLEREEAIRERHARKKAKREARKQKRMKELEERRTGSTGTNPRLTPSEEHQADETLQALETSEHDMSEENPAPEKAMTDAEVKKQIADDTKELFLVHKLDHAERYLRSLPVNQRYRMVDSVFSRALGGNDAETTLASNFFAQALSAGMLISEDVGKGLTSAIGSSDNITVDTPAAYSFVAKMFFLAERNAVVVAGHEKARWKAGGYNNSLRRGTEEQPAAPTVAS